MSELIAAVIGAAVALIGTGLWRYVENLRSGQVLADAFWEELGAVNFRESEFDTFTTQVFDTQFEKLFSLPDTLRRDLMRYHWKMRFLHDALYGLGGMNPRGGAARAEERWAYKQVAAARVHRDDLQTRLRWYADVHVTELLYSNSEKRFH